MAIPAWFPILSMDSEESLSSERSMRLIYKDTAGSMNAIAANAQNYHKLIAGFHLKNSGAAIDPPGNNGLHCRYLHTRHSHEGDANWWFKS